MKSPKDMSSELSGDLKCNRADGEFIAMARNAHEIMCERGWGLKFGQSGWKVVFPSSFYPADTVLYPLMNAMSADPFVTIVEADKWWKENVENKS